MGMSMTMFVLVLAGAAFLFKDKIKAMLTKKDTANTATA
jgi:hypothetical protein